MINQKDIKALKQHESISGKVFSWLIIVAPIFLIIVGILNIKIATDIGAKQEYSLSALFQSWIDGINTNMQYTGFYLLAMERLQTALLQFGTAIIVSVMAIAHWVIRKRDLRILETMRNHGIIKD